MDQNVGLPSVIRVFSRENKDIYYYMAVEAGMEMLKRRSFHIDNWYRRWTETWGTLKTFLWQLWESMTLALSDPEQLQLQCRGTQESLRPSSLRGLYPASWWSPDTPTTTTILSRTGKWNWLKHHIPPFASWNSVSKWCISQDCTLPCSIVIISWGPRIRLTITPRERW